MTRTGESPREALQRNLEEALQYLNVATEAGSAVGAREWGEAVDAIAKAIRALELRGEE